jgi:hypothetical protein
MRPLGSQDKTIQVRLPRYGGSKVSRVHKVRWKAIRRVEKGDRENMKEAEYNVSEGVEG